MFSSSVFGWYCTYMHDIYLERDRPEEERERERTSTEAERWIDRKQREIMWLLVWFENVINHNQLLLLYYIYVKEKE